MNKIKALLFLVLFSSLANATEMGVPVQLKFKDPSGLYPDATGVTFTVQILSPTNGCVLREEDFANQTVVSGTISLALGSGNRAGFDPNIGSLTSVYDNSAAKNSLTCVDVNNNVVGSNQSYNPASTDTRVLRVRATINGTPLVADFIQRSTPYAIHAESVGGKVAADILVQNSGTALNQGNLETLLSNATRFTKLQNLAVNGLADAATTATTAGTATNFTASLNGDVTGTQSATTVAGIRGITVAATAPTSGQVLGYNGTQYVPMTFVASAPVASVNGQTGAVVLTASNISGAVTSATALLGDVTGNVSATVVSSVGGKSAATIASTVNTVSAATALATANTLALRDNSGNLVATGLVATGASVQNIFVYNGGNTNRVQIRAPGAFADYTLVLPTTDGNSGEVLQTDGSGNLTWAAGTSVTSSSIIAALGYTPADDVVVVKRSNNLSDLVSATVARVNLGLGGAATLNVGTSTGTVAAGDDSRITGALQQTSFNNYVASASCSAGQSLYWNSVSSQFLCTNVTLSGDATGNVSAVTVTKLQGTGVSFASIANGHILQYNGTNIINRAIPTCNAGEYLTFNGTVWSCVVDAGSAGSLASLSVTAPISSTGGANPTISIPAATASVNGYLTSADWTTFNSKLTSSAASVAATLGYTPANSATVTLKANNLSDLANVATARTNLGLGTFATASTIDLGSSSATGTIADARLYSVGAGVTSGTQYTKVTVDGKGRVTSGAQISSSDVTTALGFTPADAAASGSFVVKSNNLSDLSNVATARTNLGLGTFATASTIDLGSASATGTIADARLYSVGAGVSSGTQYTKVTVDGKGRVTSGAQLSSADVTTALGYTPANNSASGTYLVKASNLSDLASSATARANLGLSISAISPVGTSAGTVAAGDDARITGSLSQTNFNTYVASASCLAGQSMYWNSVSSTFLCQNITLSGDATGIVSTVTVTKLQGTGVSFASIANGHILQYNGSNIVNRAVPTCSANQYLTFNGTVWSCASDMAAAGIVSAVTATAPILSSGGNTPVISIPQATGSVSGYLGSADWTTFNNKVTSSAASVSAVFGYTPVSMTQLTNYPLKANNLSDLSNVATARTNLGLGSFATASSIDLGSASATGTLDTARLPAMAGDVNSSAGSNSLTVQKIQGVAVSTTAPTTGQYMVYDGTNWVPTTSLDSTVRKTADQTMSASAAATVTQMAFSVSSGVNYKFKFNVLFQCAATNTGAKFSLTVPAGTIAATAAIPSTSTDGTDTVWQGYITSSSDLVQATNCPATATTLFGTVEGVFMATANGTLQFTAGTETSGTVITIKAGSSGQMSIIP